MFGLEFRTENEAFEDEREIPRILKLVASQVERGSRSGLILDSNGNTVGNWGTNPDRR